MQAFLNQFAPDIAGIIALVLTAIFAKIGLLIQTKTGLNINQIAMDILHQLAETQAKAAVHDGLDPETAVAQIVANLKTSAPDLIAKLVDPDGALMTLAKAKLAAELAPKS